MHEITGTVPHCAKPFYEPLDAAILVLSPPLFLFNLHVFEIPILRFN